jgi:transposase
LAEILRARFTAVYVKTIDSHRIKTLLDARDLLVKIKRSLSDQVRSLLHPFGIVCSRVRE